jgi:hypothetical protein
MVEFQDVPNDNGDTFSLIFISFLSFLNWFVSSLVRMVSLQTYAFDLLRHCAVRLIQPAQPTAPSSFALEYFKYMKHQYLLLDIGR